MLTETIVPDAPRRVSLARAGTIDRAARGVVFAALERLQEGTLTIRDGGTSRTFGSAGASPDLRATLVVEHPRFYRAVALAGTLGAGEAYIDGDWSCDNLTALFRIVQRNEAAFARLNGPWSALQRLGQRAAHAVRRNTRRGSGRNIAAHYDLSNDFYRLFLDATMTYSCALFESPSATLEDASRAKLERVCRKLQLGPRDHVVEIGTGWGSFAMHAASRYGCQVTTTTISTQQYELARSRIAEAGLAERITVLRQDYRDLVGCFDKLVSIEMIEAVGWQYYPTYFHKCSSLLKPDGVACIQAITMADRYFPQHRRSVDFIKRYVFPGSSIPSIGAMASAIARASDLTIAHLEDLTPHYATTLQAWYDRFRAAATEVRALGFSDSFLRLWEYYLCYCEAGFRERTIGDVQLLLVKPSYRGSLPLGALS